MRSASSLASVLALTLVTSACSASTPPTSQQSPHPAGSSQGRLSGTTSAGRSPSSGTSPSSTPTPSVRPSEAPQASLVKTPGSYRTEVVHRGSDHPDDIVLDASGALLYSDYTNGTISRLNADGSATVVHQGLSGPEGMVLLPDGTLVVAEEDANRLVAFHPHQPVAAVLVTLPGTPVMATCHQGVDGIAWDATTGRLVVPDPVTGTVYRISSDGASRTALAHGFVHPVGAAVGSDGGVYVADECGGGVWRLGPGGARVRVALAVMPDDVALDGAGNLLVTDVRHTRHDVRRWPRAGGPSTLLAGDGLIEPQGLLVRRTGAIFIADDQARVILRLTPRS
jgi:streptogramin lyase